MCALKGSLEVNRLLRPAAMSFPLFRRSIRNSGDSPFVPPGSRAVTRIKHSLASLSVSQNVENSFSLLTLRGIERNIKRFAGRSRC